MNTFVIRPIVMQDQHFLLILIYYTAFEHYEVYICVFNGLCVSSV